MNKKLDPNDLFSLDLQDDFKRTDTNDIVNFLKHHLETLNKIADERDKENDRAIEYASQIRIKGDNFASEQSNAIVEKFAEQFSSDIAKQEEIKGICGDYVCDREHPEVPLFGLFPNDEGTLTSRKLYNYVAQFRFKSFCQQMYQLFALGESIGSYGNGEESILDLIVNVTQTICLLTEQITIGFSEEESLLIKTIIEVTHGGRYDATEEQIIEAYQNKKPEVSKPMIEAMNTKFSTLKVISIDNCNIKLIERIYFNIK